MIIGQPIVATSDAADTVYYSPWFARGGNAATFACELIAFLNLTHFKITVQTKNSEESDKDQSTVVPANGENVSIGLSDYSTTTFTVGAALNSASNGFLELVRFKFMVRASSGNAGKAFAHFRMLNPAWLTN